MLDGNDGKKNTNTNTISDKIRMIIFNKLSLPIISGIKIFSSVHYNCQHLPII